MLRCTGPCHAEDGQMLPEHRFLETDIIQQELEDVKDTVRCVRCIVAANAEVRQVPFTCEHCGEDKTLREGTYAIAKSWLLNNYFKQPRLQCYACHFPPCSQCGQEPEDPLPSAERVNGTCRISAFSDTTPATTV